MYTPPARARNSRGFPLTAAAAWVSGIEVCKSTPDAAPRGYLPLRWFSPVAAGGLLPVLSWTPNVQLDVGRRAPALSPRGAKVFLTTSSFDSQHSPLRPSFHESDMVRRRLCCKVLRAEDAAHDLKRVSQCSTPTLRLAQHYMAPPRRRTRRQREILHVRERHGSACARRTPFGGWGSANESTALRTVTGSRNASSIETMSLPGNAAPMSVGPWAGIPSSSLLFSADCVSPPTTARVPVK